MAVVVMVLVEVADILTKEEVQYMSKRDEVLTRELRTSDSVSK